MKLTAPVEQLIFDIEQELTGLFNKKLVQIVLYGSYARGDFERDSDVDIIALVADDNLKKYDKEILRINVDLSLKYDIDLSLFLENDTDFNMNKNVIPLYKNIQKEGIPKLSLLPTWMQNRSPCARQSAKRRTNQELAKASAFSLINLKMRILSVIQRFLRILPEDYYSGDELSHEA